MTLRQAHLFARFRDLSRLILAGVRRTEDLGRHLGVSSRHVRRLLRRPEMWAVYEPLADAWFKQRIVEAAAERCRRLGIGGEPGLDPTPMVPPRVRPLQ